MAELPQLPIRYRVVRPLGSGTAAEVFLAQDTVLDAPVAFKVVRRNLAMHRRFRARFNHEVALSSRLVHPNLVPVHDTGVLKDGRPFVALAYAQGGNLRDVLRAGLPFTRLLSLAEQVCRALAALHARGLVHQDLKPENVLVHLDEEGVPHAWVADLGVADQVIDLLRGEVRLSGTPTYMAPEQLQGRSREVGPWTDLYALGLILFEAVSGARPFEGLRGADMLQARLQQVERPVPSPGLQVPDGLLDLIQHLLDPEPRQRYDRAADVRRALRQVRRDMGANDPQLQVDLAGSEDSALDRTTPIAKALVASASARPTGALIWRRVPPKEMPEAPPGDHDAPPPASLALYALRESPLLERDGEAQAIWDVARSVVDGQRARVVLVVGHRGVGKSHLVRSVATKLDEGAWMEVVRLRYGDPPGLDDGYPGAVRELLVPWHDTRAELEARLARWLARDQETTLGAVRNQAKLLTRWCGQTRPGESQPNIGMGLHYLYQHLDLRAWRGGSCVVMDDVHLAEEPGDGLDMAEALLDEAVGRRPVLVLATVSAEALARRPELRDRVDALVEQGAHRVDLAPLTQDQIFRVLSHSHRLDEELAERVAERVVNHPLFAGMVLRECAARGVLRADSRGRLVLKPGVDVRRILPRDLDTLFRNRLQGVVESADDPRGAAEALAAVALVGQAPPTELVRSVSESGLDALLASGVVRRDGGVLRFEDNALGQTATLLAQELPTRETLHMRLAQAWRALGERTGGDVALPVGLHLLKGGAPDEALGHLLRSVRSMIERGRFQAALRASEHALQAADALQESGAALAKRMEARRLQAIALLELDRPEKAYALAVEAGDLGWGERLTRTRLTLLKARAQAELQHSEQAEKLLSSALQSFWAMRDKQGLAKVALTRGRMDRRQNRLTGAIEHFEEVLTHLPDTDPSSVVALSGLVHVFLIVGNPERARPLVERLAAAARRTGDTRTAAYANYAAGTVMLAERYLPEAERLFSTARANAATTGDTRMQLNALNSMGEVARARGEIETARATYSAYTSLARARGYRLLEAVGRINIALIELQKKRYRKADLEARRAGQAMVKQQRSWVWVYVGIIRCACAAVSGDLTKTEQWWNLSVERGLKRTRARDLWTPLSILVTESGTHGWAQLEAEAWQILADIRR
jgi:serine/threonine-protein kinase